MNATVRRTDEQDGAAGTVTVENTSDKHIGQLGFTTRYFDRYDNLLETNDANYMKRDLVKTVIPPHQRRPASASRISSTSSASTHKYLARFQ